MKLMQSLLSNAVDKTSELRGSFCSGLGAVEGTHKSKIYVGDSRLINGSLNIDKAVEALYPTENRWDYAIEYRNEVYFVEFHPAQTSEVSVVLDKLIWLKQWLSRKAPEIDRIKVKSGSPYYWVFTKDCHILPSSSYWKRLAQKGITPQKCLNLN